MIHPIKLTSPLDKVFAVGDTHWRHDRPFIIGPRGFKTIEDHDETIVRRWVERVPADSTVLHLGDVICMSDEPAFWSFLRRVSFARCFILLSNHLSGHKQAYQTALKAQYPDVALHEAEVYPLTVLLDGDPARQVTFLPEYAEFSIAKERWVCSHYAIESWHQIGHGVIHLHAHSHGSLKTKLNRRRDVGIECYGGPVSLAQLAREMQSEAPAVTDHHGEPKPRGQP